MKKLLQKRGRDVHVTVYEMWALLHRQCTFMVSEVNEAKLEKDHVGCPMFGIVLLLNLILFDR